MKIEAIKTIIENLAHNETVVLAFNCVVRLFLAIVFGGLIGYEREHSHRPAGLRTHVLVAIGATLVMLTGDFMSAKSGGTIDPTRIGAQVVSGIGFLGAGTILREGFSVKGLTTAASLWAVSCIGLAVGAGHYIGATLATLLIFLTLNALKKLFLKRIVTKRIFVEVKDVSVSSVDVSEIINQCDIELDKMELFLAGMQSKKIRSPEAKAVLKIDIFVKNVQVLDLVVNTISTLDSVLDVYVE